MRGAFGLLVLGACFTPSPPAGAPCDPVTPACPSGQSCVASAQGYACSAFDGGMMAIDDAPADGTTATSQTIYKAAIAECVAPMLPDPSFCRMLNGNAELVIDVRDSTTEQPWNAYLRFETDGALQRKTIVKVTLRLVATNDAKAPGPDSGSVFGVQAFTRTTLSQGVPAKIGNVLAGTQGEVSVGEVVMWTLPPSIVTAGSPVYLGLFANDDDGVNYFNTDGADPPQLIIDTQ